MTVKESGILQPETAATLVLVRTRISTDIDLGSEHRHRLIVRRLKSAVKRCGAIEINEQDGEVISLFPTQELAERATQTLSNVLSSYERDKVPPKVLEEALSITSKERVAWTKAGLLRTSGHELFHAGRQAIRVPLYAAAEVRYLRRNPSQVEAWRAET